MATSGFLSFAQVDHVFHSIFLFGILGTFGVVRPAFAQASGSFLRPVDSQAKCTLFCYYLPRITANSYRQSPSDLQPGRCSHLIFGFARFSLDHGLQADNTNEDLPSPARRGLYSELNLWKIKHPRLQTLLAVRVKNSDMRTLQSDYRRKLFVQGAGDFLRQNNFDGVVFHLLPEDYLPVFMDVLKEFRDVAHGTLKPLTVVVSMPANSLGKFSGSFAELEELIDYLHLEPSVLYSEDAPILSHMNALNSHGQGSKPEETISFQIGFLRNLHFSRQKIVVGLSAWARTFTVNATTSYLGATVEDGKGGPVARIIGWHTYAETCALLNRTKTKILQDKKAGAAYIRYRDMWVSLNEPSSLQTKIAWLRSKAVGGASLYSLDIDDAEGTCDQGPFPLLNTIASELNCLVPEVAQPAPTLQFEKGAKKCLRMCYYIPQREVLDAHVSFAHLNPHWCSAFSIGFVNISTNGVAAIPTELARAFEDLKARRVLYVAQWYSGDETLKDWHGWSLMLTVELTESVLEQFATYERRKTVIESLLRTQTELQSDGYDFYLKSIRANQAASFSLFLREFRHAIVIRSQSVARKLSMVLSVNAEVSYTDILEYSVINEVVDYVNLLSNFHSIHSNVTGHHTLFVSPEPSKNSMEGLASFWTQNGIPRSRIIVGLSAQAQTQHLNLELVTINKQLAAQGPGMAGPYTNTSGSLAYFETCQLLTKPESQSLPQSSNQAPASIYDKRHYVSYDNVNSIAAKVQWASFNDYAGVSFWSLEYDDAAGLCPGHTRFPLLQTVATEHVCIDCGLRTATAAQNNTQPSDACVLPNPSLFCYYKVDPTTNALTPERLPLDNCTHVVFDGGIIQQNGAIEFQESDQYEVFERFLRLQRNRGGTKFILLLRCANDRWPADATEAVLAELTKILEIPVLDGIEVWCNSLYTEHMSVLPAILTLTPRVTEPDLVRDCLPVVGLGLPGWALDLDPNLLNMFAYLTLQAFNYSTALDAQLKHHSPLYSNYEIGQLSIHDTVSSWLSIGVQSDKIVLVLPTFGFSMPLLDRQHTAQQSLAGALVEDYEGVSSLHAVHPGTISFTDTCQLLRSGHIMPRLSQSQFALFAAGLGQSMAYDDPGTILFKTRYAMLHHLRGVGLWTLNADDHAGMCQQGLFPLLTTVRSALECTR